MSNYELMSKDSFALEIERRVLEDAIPYFQAIIEFSEDYNKDAEDLVPFMSQVLLDKVKKSAEDLGLVDLGSVDIEKLL